MKLPIYAYGHSIYRQEIKQVSQDIEDLPQLIRNMKETMWLLKCNALAAIHVGVPYQLFLIDMPQKGKSVFINSEVIKKTGYLNSLMETDVSIPNVSVGIDRLSNVQLKFQTEEFAQNEGYFAGKTASLIFQMMDLCKGKNMIQHLHPFRQKSLKKYLYEIRTGQHLPSYDFIIEDMRQ